MTAAKHVSSKHASSKHARKERRSAERTMARDGADRLAEAARKREASEAAPERPPNRCASFAAAVFASSLLGSWGGRVMSP